MSAEDDLTEPELDKLCDAHPLDAVWNAAVDAMSSPAFRLPNGELNEAMYLRKKRRVMDETMARLTGGRTEVSTGRTPHQLAHANQLEVTARDSVALYLRVVATHAEQFARVDTLIGAAKVLGDRNDHATLALMLAEALIQIHELKAKISTEETR